MNFSSFAGRIIPAPVKRFVESTEAYHSTIAFVAGFGYDSATLRRIDQLLDNLLLLLYLTALGLLLVVERRIAHGRSSWEWIRRHQHLTRVGIQFLFGGIYSAYVIFYFKSASLGKSLVFMGLLAALMLVNEYLGEKLRYERLQFALYFFCVFSFLLYFIPVVSGWFDSTIFLLAGFLTALVVALICWLVYRGTADEGAVVELEMAAQKPVFREIRTNGTIWGAILGVLFLLYYFNIIPPVPLSLSYSGVFHDVKPAIKGYELVYEKRPWYKFWVDDDSNYLWREGDKVHCFTAIFAPKGMELEIWHRWQRWDEKKQEWEQTDRIPFQVVGGREGGFRGFTKKKNLAPGKWRVIVETAEDRELGQVSFMLAKSEIAAAGWDQIVY